MSVTAALATAAGAAFDSGMSADWFFEQLSHSRERVLLLDYDGTIAPFSANRHRAFPYPTVPELLDCIASTCRTRVALITGRAAREIPPLLGLHPHPEIWGSYGIEYLHANGDFAVCRLPDEIQRARADADLRLAEQGLSELVEVKAGAVAVHWRGLKPSHVEEVRATAYRVLAPLAGAGLLLADFEGGVELRLRMRSKGDVVRRLMAEHPPHVPIAFLGDETSDEDAFRALNGRGLTVLVRPTYRFTAAQVWIRPPSELVQFLSAWVQACGGEM